jgi:hypothetical protein
LRLARRPATISSALHGAIAQRHTNRFAYRRDRPVAPAWRAWALAESGEDARVVLIEAGPARRMHDANVLEATEAIIADAQMIGDSDRWFRGSRAEIEAHRDGPTLETAGLSPLRLMLARMLPVSRTTSHAAWLELTRDTQLATAALTGLIAVRDRYDRAAAIATGRLWQRLQLSATVLGMALQPLNQPIEMIDRELQLGAGRSWHRRLAALTGDDWQATFSFRAGYGVAVSPASPRRRLSEVIVS